MLCVCMLPLFVPWCGAVAGQHLDDCSLLVELGLLNHVLCHLKKVPGQGEEQGNLHEGCITQFWWSSRKCFSLATHS